MDKLKDFYKAISNKSGLEILDFIIKTTNKDLTMLVQLNCEFNNLCLQELEQTVKYYKAPDYIPINPLFENLIDENCDSSTPTDTDSVLVVNYFLDNGIVSFNEEKLQLEMLQFRDYNRVNCKIKEFQRCIKLQIESHQNPKKEELLDLSNSNITEKIIYLNELGIIDFLKTKQPFNTSSNRLAIALSALTGEKTSTLQSYINPLLNAGTVQKNNPLTKTEKVKKIRQALIEIGFNVNKSI